jgi:hypothetical protein
MDFIHKLREKAGLIKKGLTSEAVNPSLLSF